jgi:aerobic carbon-monoxide dehydrogenase large subunit
MRRGIGAPVRRLEDRRLLTGNGRFTDDIDLPGQAYACVVRTAHAHARIRRIDVAAAQSMPGVLAVLTGADYRAEGWAGIPHFPNPADINDPTRRGLHNTSGAAVLDVAQAPLAIEVVRHVGEGVALVVAETDAAARDAAGRVAVDYEPLAVVADCTAARDAAAPALWHEAPDNRALDMTLGDQRAVAAAFAGAAHVVRLDTTSNRLAAVTLEPRAALAVWDEGLERLTLIAGSQGVIRYRLTLARMLKMPAARIRVVCHDVGGGFGMKNSFYPEYALVVWAARRLARPVKWVCRRSEAFLSDSQGRDFESEAALALDAAGNFLGLRVHHRANNGAHFCSYVPVNNAMRMATSLYAVPAAHMRAEIVLTNRVPVSPYRGAGRPEAVFVLERLIDIAAATHGFDRVGLRRRNLIARAHLPYTNPFGVRLADGDYRRDMDEVLALAGWDGFAARRRAAEKRGRLAGIGLANYIETPVGWPHERAEITVQPAGVVEVVIGTQSSGQGHATAFAQIIATLLGVEPEDVVLRTGDTDFVDAGGGSHSVRSMRLGGVVMSEAAARIIDQGRTAAAAMLAAAPDDVVFAEGRFRVAGKGRAIGLFALAAALDAPLAASAEIADRVPAFPSGAAVCEVEIDPETGAVGIVRYNSVDDVGRMVNPLLVAGQIHGGIAQGVGQALMEHCVYDRDGQLLTGSLMDYALPRAADLPFFTLGPGLVPATSNALGIKGAGEGGITPAPAAVVNAIVDALAPYGVRHIEMPATPERIWRAIRDGRAPTPS